MTPFERVPSAEGLGIVPMDPVSFASLRPSPDREERAKERKENKLVYDFFLPGPLYFHTLLDKSLVGGFREAALRQSSPGWSDLPIRYSVWKFRRPLVSNCGDWNNLLCAMDCRSFLYFKQWLSTMHFVDRGRRLVFIPSFEQAAILDPFLLDGKNVTVPERITVICPMCREWHIKPSTFAGVEKSAAPAKIDLEFTKPLPEMLKALEELADELKI